MEFVFENTVFKRKMSALLSDTFEIKFNSIKIYDAILLHHNIKARFSLNFFLWRKIKLFYFLFESQFTSFGQTLFNLYEIQMVSDFLGHPVPSYPYMYEPQKKAFYCQSVS